MYDLKSKVIDIYDFKNIDLQEIVEPFQLEEADIDDEIERLRKKNAVSVEAETVEAGDIVEISCKSESSRFNKDKVSLKVGLGLFSKQIESQLRGMKTGETASVSEKSGTVEVKILKVTRTVLPELTDKNVSKWGLEKVKNVAGLRSYIISSLKQQYIADVAESYAIYIQNLANEKSVFELDSEELEDQKKAGEKMALEMIKSQGFDPDTITEDEAQEILGKTKAEHIEFLKDSFVSSFKSGLVGLALMEQKGLVLTADDHNKSLQEYMLATGADMDEAKKVITFDKFIIGQGADKYLDEVEGHVKEYLARG
jgi:FKBP-type peptidyl-prolyl cis-trans isomerase (trigger factor)